MISLQDSATSRKRGCILLKDGQIRSELAWDAALRRLCNPTAVKHKLKVSQDIMDDWAKGGTQRHELLSALKLAQGDKDVSYKKLTVSASLPMLELMM